MNSINQHANLLKTLKNTGYITTQLANKYMNFSLTQLNYMEIKGIIYSLNVMIFGKLVKIYKLTDSTQDVLRRKGYKIYKHDSTQLEHDYALLKIYLSLDSTIQHTWKNETELKELYPSFSSTCDATFTINNNIIGVEIITSTYSKLTIQEKMDFLTNYCDNHIIKNISSLKIRGCNT